MPRPRRSGRTYSSSRSATGPSYQTFGRRVTRATALAGSPASSAIVDAPPSSARRRVASTATPGVGVSNSVLKSCSSAATTSASCGSAMRTTAPYSSPGRGNCDASMRSHMPSVISARWPTSSRADGVTR